MTNKQIILRLFNNHFYDDGGLQWSYIEGTTLEEVDPELAYAIAEVLANKCGLCLSNKPCNFEGCPNDQ